MFNGTSMRVLPRVAYDPVSVIDHIINEVFAYSSTYAFSNLQDYLKNF